MNATAHRDDGALVAWTRGLLWVCKSNYPLCALELGRGPSMLMGIRHKSISPPPRCLIGRWVLMTLIVGRCCIEALNTLLELTYCTITPLIVLRTMPLPLAK